ncbi:MAG: substrate-binding domain-containing protein [Oscillospiraceae bacterium]|nr:substrate-binding domain-containing protein [Oscillospiraceae bacterium]
MYKKIGILIGRPYHSINRPQLAGILKACYASGRSAYVFTINEEFYEERALHAEWNLLHVIQDECLDGIIWLPYTFSRDDTKAEIRQYLKAHFSGPVVVIASDPEEYPHVWFDEKSAFEAVVTHLIREHGCRDILCLTGPVTMQTSFNRADGWRNAMHAAGLEAPEERLVYGDYWINAPQVLARELTDGTRTMPDAVVCGNDRMAMSLCDALAERGVQVPQSLLVTGFDGIPDAQLHSPSITSVSPDWEQLGSLAMEKLLSLLEGTVPSAPAARCCLSWGESCGHQRSGTTAQVMYYHVLEARYLDSLVANLKASDDSVAELIRCIYRAMDSSREDAPGVHALCLCSDWNRTEFLPSGEHYRMEGYSPQMLCMQEDGSGIPFPLSRMVPEQMDGTVPCVTFFVPLYFHDRCFGYSLLRMDGAADSYDIYHLRFCREVGSVLAFFCLQSEYRSLAFRSAVRGSRDELTGLYVFDRSEATWQGCADTAQLYGETLYLMAFCIGGLGQLTDVENRLAHDRVLLAVSDILLRNCRGHEQVFDAENGAFLVMGSQLPPVSRPEILKAQIDAQFEESGIREAHRFIYLTSACMLCDTAAPVPVRETVRALLEQARAIEQPSFQVGQHYQRLSALRREIYSNPEEGWTVEECARRMQMSQSYFLKVYRRAFGWGCSQDIQHSKLAYAKKLLLQTNLILQDIAEKCGYDYSHFMRLFKKEVGMTPTAYRKGSTG